MSLDKPDIRIGISACLLGQKVRYDSRHKQDHYITDTLGCFFQWVPLCPEVEYGLPVPREPMHLIDDPASLRLITIHTGIDHTDGMKKWTEDRLDRLAQEGLYGFIFRSRSPSCGIRSVEIYTKYGTQIKKGAGIFAAAFIQRFPLVPVVDDDDLKDQILRESFIERISLLSGQQELFEKGCSRFLYPPST